MEYDSAGQVISGFIERQLTTERTIKTSLEGRGLAIVAAVGTLMTLLLAFAAIFMPRLSGGVNWPRFTGMPKRTRPFGRWPKASCHS